jgi:hypothetical protein
VTRKHSASLLVRGTVKRMLPRRLYNIDQAAAPAGGTPAAAACCFLRTKHPRPGLLQPMVFWLE